jgi:hypothetical protein
MKHKRLIILLAILGLSAGLLWHMRTNARLHEVDMRDASQVVNAFLSWQPNTATLKLEGKGTKDNPYIIATDKDLLNLADAVNLGRKSFAGEHFLLTADIDLTNHMNEKDSGLGWKPIGKNDEIPFSGIFDGGGHTISGFYSSYNDPHLGLFGYTTNAQLRNLHIVMAEDKTINAPNTAGVLVGRQRGSRSIVENCTAVGNIVVTENRPYDSVVGGLIGHAEGGRIVDCEARVNITLYGGRREDAFAGGLVGFAWGVDIINCHAYGDVTIYPRENTHNVSNDLVAGGLVGVFYNVRKTVEITHSSAHGTVTVSTDDPRNKIRTGGLVGIFQNNPILRNKGYIRYSYATGDVYASGSGIDLLKFIYIDENPIRAGGFVGDIMGGEVANSYATGQVSADGSLGIFIGGFSGFLFDDGRIVHCYATGLAENNSNHLFHLGSSFVGLFIEDESSIVNNFFDMESTQQSNATPIYDREEGIVFKDRYPGLYGRTTHEMQTQATFEGWCFEDVWMMPTGGGYPVLRRNP